MSRAPEHTRPDLYSRVTAQIVEDLQRGVRRHAGGLVEQQHAVDAPARAAHLRDRHSLSWLRSDATASSISFDRRMPDSIESS